ncbi:MAG TPA: helix-turn-helix domain-containing protein, partial [Candidatus Polarisedimenticolia bacterium]|nr:helix-turn-helix domain-containing protein [Candidatus Polarisedimenticolia bacterium]
FREDLFYRLNVVEIALPPLRDRGEDIPLLVETFLRKYAAANGKAIDSIAPDALQAIAAWSWPGNVRQLEHAIERAVILARGPVLGLELFPALPAPVSAGRSDDGGAGPRIPGASMDDIERDAIIRTLESVGGSVSRAAAILQISPRTIQYKMKRYRADGAVVRPGD